MASTRSSTPIRTIPPGTLPIIVSQFDQPGRSEHWALIIVASTTTSHTFEIRGNRDSYTYVPGVIRKPLSGVTTYRGGCHVGNIPEDKMDEAQHRFKEIPIIKQDARWDPQVWVLEALKVLKEDGWVFQGVNEAFVRNELQEDMVRWNSMDDTVDERLLSEMETGVPVQVDPPTEKPPSIPAGSPKNKSPALKDTS